jgi:predicted metal-binding membrane protein
MPATNTVPRSRIGQFTAREWIVGMVLVATALVAWASLWWWGHALHGPSAHHGHGAPTSDAVIAFGLFIIGWLLMTTAMMLPTTLPLVALFQRLVGRRSNRLVLTALLVSGYVGVWLVFGVAAYAGDQVLHEVVDRIGWLAARPWLVGSGLVIAAGLYQFSGLKERCLTACRQPLALIMRHWTGASSSRQAWGIGVIHGMTCVGCCWPLMLLMFAFGAANLALMLALTALMAVEKNLSWGQRLTTPLGATLVVVGIGLAALRVPVS